MQKLNPTRRERYSSPRLAEGRSAGSESGLFAGGEVESVYVGVFYFGRL